MDKKLIIVGAGASGVAVATKLVLNGFKNITILEAENRIGGRVHTIPFGANIVDMGAQWCHGEKNNVVYEMAKDKNLLERSTGSRRFPEFIRSNGEAVPVELAKKIFNSTIDIFDGERYEDERTAYHGSFGNFFAEKFNAALKTEEFKEIDHELAHQIHDSFQQYVNSVDAADSWYQSSCDLHEYEECEGDQSLTWKDKGYGAVLDLLQNKIAGGDAPPQHPIDILPFVQFNKEVSKIAYNQPDGLIKVECSDGSSFTADHLICTVSLGVLKERHLKLFEPMLPLWKYEAIDGMMIGTVDKIYLEFDEPFWNEGWEGFSIFWKLEQLKEVRGDPINGDWLEGLIGFYTFNSYQPNMISGWLIGPLARKMEQKSDADVKAGAEKVLRMILKGKNIPDAKAMVRSKWYSNPHFRGSYSTFTLKTEALGTNPNKLAEPINDSNGKPAIQFAGEATSSKYFGNVHGAVDSGWREANRLIELYK